MCRSFKAPSVLAQPSVMQKVFLVTYLSAFCVYMQLFVPTLTGSPPSQLCASLASWSIHKELGLTLRCLMHALSMVGMFAGLMSPVAQW